MTSAYSVKQLAQMAGVSVRTLHLYDQIGLLKPATRTATRYRWYGEKELLRLQQILFYKELDFPLQQIGAILDDPGFDLVQALESHKEALKARGNRIAKLLVTIDKTISKLKNNAMLKDEELYEGLSKEEATSRRNEAIEKYGAEAVQRSEAQLKSMDKADFEALKKESEDIYKQLKLMMHEDPCSQKVQEQIARHYNTTRSFWGTTDLADNQAKVYKGLGQLYVNDERFTLVDGKPNPEYALFLSKAMKYFAETQLEEK